jgi:hypothetical protein
VDVLDRVGCSAAENVSDLIDRGILTLGVGIASFWLMPPSPSQTKSKHRPNGYLTDREVKIIVNRTLRDDPGKVSNCEHDMVADRVGKHAQSTSSQPKAHLGGSKVLPHLASLLYLAHLQSTHCSGNELSPNLVPELWLFSTNGQSIGGTKYGIFHNQPNHHYIGIRSREQSKFRLYDPDCREFDIFLVVKSVADREVAIPLSRSTCNR